MTESPRAAIFRSLNLLVMSLACELKETSNQLSRIGLRLHLQNLGKRVSILNGSLTHSLAHRFGICETLETRRV